MCYTVPLRLTFSPVLLQIEQAIDCLVDIAKRGESAAAEYREEPPNARCKKMAEAFFENMNMNN